ncbi:MAG TPA: xanthine dehydrogenase family protein molybdopterin-binding subunit [Thermotogota bacterium]|nr:xanthine dehydrogenase family protein molybdopterin-binding subunit [Thermotogota bacterium]HRW91886.1 xanthine dehydrogenase family protein molybdopterin-binding subunit [Thermotogota bacterium]
MEERSPELGIVGQRVLRVDGSDKVRGKAQYIADLFFDRMLYVGIVVAGIPHGILQELDFSAARQIPGVEGFVTWQDIPGENQMGDIIPDYPALLKPGDRIRYNGDYVALVAATTPEIARLAAKQVKVIAKPLPGVFSIEESLTNEVKIEQSGNQPIHHKVRKGMADPDTMFSESDIQLQASFFADYQEQAYLETQGVLARSDENGCLVVYGSMQCPYYVQEGVSKALGLPYQKVRVIQTETGGAFGGKEDVPTYFAIPAALVCHKFGRPAKLVLQREEDIQWTSKRHPVQSTYRLGVKKDGTLDAVQVEALGDMGAHGTLSPLVLWRSSVHAAGAYAVPNVRVDVKGTLTNKVPCGAYRGFGSPQVFFAMEAMMDMAAEKLGMDPLEFRLRNVLQPGATTSTGHRMDASCVARQTLEMARELSDWNRLQARVQEFNRNHQHVRQGIGLSHIHYGVSLGAMGRHLDASGAFVQVFKDGTVSLQIGGTEMGQGAKTTMAILAAEILGQKVQKVRMNQTDTAFLPDSGPTVASRTTIFSGNAVVRAAQQVASKMKQYYAQQTGVPIAQVKSSNGVFSGSSGEKPMDFEAVAYGADRENLGLFATGWFETPFLQWDKENGVGEAYVTYAFATQIAVVEVNLLTAHVQVREAYCVHDVGKAINREGVVGQIQGGFVQGMGYALYENLQLNDAGKILSDNFNTLTIPTFHEMPETFRVGLVETPFPQGPFGAKGIGEPSLIPAPAAIANAVSHALGKRVHKIPIRKSELLEQIVQP